MVPPADAASIIDAAPEGLIVLDVRTPEEFAEGHLADAINIDIADPAFGARLEELDPNSTVVLYCRCGNRSARAREVMAEMGFTDVADVGGGIVAWTTAGLPLAG